VCGNDATIGASYLIRGNENVILSGKGGQVEELVVALHSLSEEGLVEVLGSGDLPQERCLAHR
jgi:hypothetical protein